MAGHVLSVDEALDLISSTATTNKQKQAPALYPPQQILRIQSNIYTYSPLLGINSLDLLILPNCKLVPFDPRLSFFPSPLPSPATALLHAGNVIKCFSSCVHLALCPPVSHGLLHSRVSLPGVK